MVGLPCDEKEEEPLLTSTQMSRQVNQRGSSAWAWRPTERCVRLLVLQTFMSQEEYLQTVASRVLYSGSCGVFYLSLLVASLTEIVWMLHPWIGHCCHLSYPKSKLFFAVEAYLSVGLFGETILRMLWQRRRFWNDAGNIFDAAVSVLSVLSLVLYLDHLSKDLELVVLLMMTLWVGLRLARLVLVARRLHSRRRAAAQRLDVNFSCGLEGGCEDDEEEPPSECRGIEMNFRGESNPRVVPVVPPSAVGTGFCEQCIHVQLPVMGASPRNSRDF